MKESRKQEPWNPLLKSYPESEKINSVSIGAETMYTRLIAKADDHGNYYGNPLLILSYLFGHRFAAGDVSVSDTGRWRAELETATLITLYEVENETYLHVISPHRRLRNDVKLDERFPEETTDANDDKKQCSEHGPDTGRTRAEHGPLEETQKRLDPEKIKIKELQPNEKLPATKSKRLSLKGLSKKEIVSIYEKSPDDAPTGYGRPQMLAAALNQLSGFTKMAEALTWKTVMMRLGQLFNGHRKVTLEYHDLMESAFSLKSLPKPKGKPASLDYLVACLTETSQSRMADRFEQESQQHKAEAGLDGVMQGLAAHFRMES